MSMSPANAMTPDAAAARIDRGTLVLLCIPILAATILSKLSVPPYSALGIGVALPLTALAIIAAAFTNRLRIEPSRLAYFCLALTALAFPAVFKGDSFSLTSFALLIALHVPYVFVFAGGHRHSEAALRFFLGIAGILSWLGIAQVALQSVVHSSWLFPIENFVPPTFTVMGFNSQGGVGYGSALYRANGVFMLEPSYLSQYLAIAIIAELVTFKRTSRVALYGVALLSAFSGTGLMVLGICLPLLILLHKRWDVLLLMTLAVLIAIAVADFFQLGILASRTSEFNNPQSSAYARFIGGFYVFDQLLWNDAWRTFFGYGPGAFLTHVHEFHYEVAEMPLFKMVFEFGLIGAAAYFTFLARCCFSASYLPPIGRLAIFLTFLLNGLYIPFSHDLAFSLLTLVSYPRAVAAREKSLSLIPRTAPI